MPGSRIQRLHLEPPIPLRRFGLLRAILNEKPIAWPDEVLRMRSAYFRIVASKIHRARILQIVVETVLRQMVIEAAQAHLNWRNVRLTSHCISVLHGKPPDALESRPLEPITHARILFAELHDSEFKREAWIFP